MGASLTDLSRARGLRPARRAAVQMRFQLEPAPLLPLVEAEAGEGRWTIAERFGAFHRRNPQVYAALRASALAMRRRGVTRYSIAGLFELLRWQYAMQTAGGEYKLNNDFRAPYARLLMEQEAELAGFFETRCRREERD